MAGNPSDSIPSNEDIIDDLTKDLQNSSYPAKSNKESTENIDSSRNRNDDASKDPWDNVGKESENETDTAPRDEPELDFVDEEAAKDRELTLSEDDKQILRNKAAELKVEGNECFKTGEYQKAAESYTEALRTCPLAFGEDRAILYANRAAAKMKYMESKKSAIADCTKAIELNPKYIKAYHRRAQFFDEEKKLDDALADYKKILELDPSHSDAKHAVKTLPARIEKANEELKTEMLGKLKDLGNLILKPFGLSTNNFELQQDPNSGGYSVKFNQNSS